MPGTLTDRGLMEMRELTTSGVGVGSRVGRAPERTASSKALRWKQARHAQSSSKMPLWEVAHEEGQTAQKGQGQSQVWLI